LVKRIFDFIFSLFGIIILFPILLFTALLSYLFQGFPIFFMHKRLGKSGKPFTMIKFRTMLQGPSLSAKDDARRLTRWGKFLRRWSIDELTVLYNVIKGDMSLVGPRPMPIKYLHRYNSFQKNRMNVKPGITGLAQIYGRNHLTWEERFDYDVKYTETQSLYMDLQIIIKTIMLVIKGVNVEAKNQEIMPEFMGSNHFEDEDSKLIK
jgi:lipopolysaccharide/colanic/teichoic acid biosynthesis glycosyltransferase